jgi:homopolymeric O-antigen transport system permease protein
MSETQVTPRQAPPAVPREDSAGATRNIDVTVIRPASAWPEVQWHELWRYRGLLGIFVWRDLKVRYKQTVIGAVWALFQPLFTALVYTFIFGRFAKFPSDALPYPIFAFAGVLAWQYFSAAFNQATSSIVGNVPLVTKVYFPRLLLPIGGVVVPLVDLALSLTVLAGMMMWFHIVPGAKIMLAPLFIGLALITALGAGLALSALTVRYRDVPYAIPLFMSVLPFLSGVMYALNALPPKWQWVLSLNPLSGVVTGWRWAVLDGSPPVIGQLAVSVAVAILMLIFGLAYFRRTEPRFADTI